MPSSSIIRDTLRQGTPSVPGASLLEAMATTVTELEDMPLEKATVEELPPATWQDRWFTEAATDDTAGAILAAAWVQAQQIRRLAETEGHAEGYAIGYAEGHATGQTEGYAAGYEAGHAEGVAAARAEEAESVQQVLTQGADVLHRATEIANATELDRTELLKAAEAQLVTTVIAVARKVVQAELRTDPELIRQGVQAAIRAIGESPVAVLHLNPDDVALLEDMWTELRERFGSGLQIVPDARIQRGGAIVDAENRTVDAQIESRLAEIERQFRMIAESDA